MTITYTAQGYRFAVGVNKKMSTENSELQTSSDQIDRVVAQLEKPDSSPENQENNESLVELGLDTIASACKVFYSTYEDWRQTRQENIKSLNDIAKAMEKRKNDSNIAEVSGSSAGVVGGILSMAGLITMPFTRE